MSICIYEDIYIYMYICIYRCQCRNLLKNSSRGFGRNVDMNLPWIFCRSLVSPQKSFPGQIEIIPWTKWPGKGKWTHIYRHFPTVREQPKPGGRLCPGFGPSSLESVGFLDQHISRPKRVHSTKICRIGTWCVFIMKSLSSYCTS